MIIEEQQSTGTEGSSAEDAVHSAARPLVFTRANVAVTGLILILLLGAIFRFTGLNWDDNHHLHPDERFLTDVATRLETTSDPLLYLRTSESPLNPYNYGFPTYVYGNFPMTVTRYVAEWASDLCGAFGGDACPYTFTAYNGIHLVGRFLSGVLDLISILFIFFIGRRLYGWRAGLLGALLMALAVMPIQQSHFFTMDNWAAGLSTVAVYMAVRAAEAGVKKRWWVLFGIFLGLAVASRINVAPLAALAGVAAVVWLARRRREVASRLSSEARSTWRYLRTPQGSLDVQRVVLGVMLAAVVSLATFRLAQPYAFADSTIAREAALAETGQEPSGLRLALESALGFNPQWLSNMGEIQGLQSPEATFPPALQWTNRASLLFPLSNMVLYGMGIAAGIAAWLGLLWALWRIVRARPDWTSHALPVAWAGAYFIFMGTRWVKSIRYFLPIYPFLLLLAGWALVELWRWAAASRNNSTLRRAAVAGLVALVVVPTALWANAFVQIYREPVTRVAASRWMFENIPTGATLLYEVDGEEREVQLPLKGFEFRLNGIPLNLNFTVPAAGVVEGMRFNYLSVSPAAAETAADVDLRLELLTADGERLAEAAETASLGPEEESLTFELAGTTLEAETPYVARAWLEQAHGENGGNVAVTADTSRIVNEEWDDLLPVGVDGKAAYAAYYSEVTGGQRPVTWPASEEKRQVMLSWIEEADVIALSSQRSLWNTPRLPLTYPLNIAYYEALFNGELGFELMAEFHADLHAGPLYISDTGGAIAWGEPPEIGWPPPGELAAEEAFSVYDHPPVWIFRKTEAYSSERAQQILGAVDMDRVVVQNPGEATRAPNGLLLSTRERVVQRAHGTFSQIFNLDGVLNRSPGLGAVVWWLSVVILGWLAFPIAFVVFRGFPGRGYALARILSLLLVSWFGWFASSYGLLSNTRGTLLLAAALMALLSLVIVARRRREIAAWVRRNVHYVLFVEGLSVLLFLIGIGIRLGNPDVWDVIWGGEKPMDLAYFTAVIKSTIFPPYDPWYAGGYINYYYYGFVYVGALTEILGVKPAVAYNLILPTLLSFTGMGAGSIAYNLVRWLDGGGEEIAESVRSAGNRLHAVVARLRSKAVMAGVTAAVLAVILGNLAEVGVLLGAWQRTSDSAIDTGIGVVDAAWKTVDGALATMVGGESAPIYPGDWFWVASRAINANEGEVAPITEFPFFTFLYGDLHAHMIALPLTMLALAWAVSLVLQGSSDTEKPDFSAKPGFLETGLLWFTGALAIGVLRATNTWDWPTYLFLGALAVIYYAYRRRGGLNWQMVGQSAVQVTALAGLSTLLFWPFVNNYGTGYESFRLWEGSYTRLGNYLVIHGLFLFLALTHIAREFRAWSRKWTVEGLSRLRPAAAPGILALLVYVLLIAFLALNGYWIAPVALTLVIVSGLLGLRPGLPVARRVILVLISSALGLTLLVEFVVLEGDIGRMNTVFKFYMQVWMMLSVAGGAALALAWPAATRRWGEQRRRLWQGALVVLVAMAALYPLLATRAKWNVRMNQDAPHTLDGTAFMPGTSYMLREQQVNLGPDYRALQWMQRNVEGSPVVAEANPPSLGEAYRSTANRVAIYTGLPAIIGWDWHQTQQRSALPNTLIHQRMADNALLFNTPNTGQARDLIERYDVGYIYVGPLEKIYYQEVGLRKFEEMADAGLLQAVYRQEGVTIYEVLQ